MGMILRAIDKTIGALLIVAFGYYIAWPAFALVAKALGPPTCVEGVHYRNGCAPR
jgi:hypothetical protein